MEDKIKVFACIVLFILGIFSTIALCICLPVSIMSLITAIATREKKLAISGAITLFIAIISFAFIYFLFMLF